MSAKELILEKVQGLSDSVTIEEILEELAILAEIQRGEQAANERRVISHEEMKHRECNTSPIEAISRPLIEAASKNVNVQSGFERYMQKLLGSPLWSLDNPGAPRILWHSATKAREDAKLRHIFDSPGLYMFVTSKGIPRYLGMTGEQSLWMRLSGQYVGGKRSQCQLAVAYNNDIITRGLENSPNDIREWRNRHPGASNVRLTGAVDFAGHGIENMWFTLLPVSDPKAVGDLEKKLIPVANAWNSDQGYPPLLNNKHTQV